MKYTIQEPATVLNLLGKLYPDSAKRTLRQMLKTKRVRVDGRVEVKADSLLSEGQELSIGGDTRNISGIQLIYDDQDFIIINKPEGLLSVPLDKGDEKNALELLREHFKMPQIFPVHRIDKGTSGVMVFAKGKPSACRLNDMFRTHNFHREYLAIVSGVFEEDNGTWKSRLIERNNYDVCSTSDPKEGRLAITHFTVLRRSKNFTYLRLRLETGKKHQIRVHCKDAGYPIVGDKRYGIASCDPISRLALHASSLAFTHPSTGKRMSFAAPLPGPFARLGLVGSFEAIEVEESSD